MAPGSTGPVASDAMEATPTLDDARGLTGPLTLEPVPEIDESDVAPVSLAHRLRQPRTILSIAVPLAIIGFFLYLNRDRLSAVPELILQANPALVLAAFLLFGGWWVLSANKWFKGPVRMGTEEELEQFEQRLEDSSGMHPEPAA